MKSSTPILMANAAGLALALALSLGLPAAAAPAKLPAKLPDWRGVWSPAEANLFDPSAFENPANKGQSGGASFLRDFPPYNAEWEAKYQAKLTASAAGRPSDPTAACLPGGMPRIMTSPYPMEFEISAERVVVLHELGPLTVRRIYTDGRKHPEGDELTFMGDSIGHWEGDTLVVDTNGIRGDTVFDVTTAQHSDQIHLSERIRRLSPVLMEDIITVEDPVAFTKPWTVRRTYKLQPTWTIREYVCNDNNRNPILPDGTTGFLPPTPKAE